MPRFFFVTSTVNPPMPCIWFELTQEPQLISARCEESAATATKDGVCALASYWSLQTDIAASKTAIQRE